MTKISPEKLRASLGLDDDDCYNAVRAAADAWEADRKRIEALEQVRFAAQSLVTAQIADGHSRRTAWANLRAALRSEEER